MTIFVDTAVMMYAGGRPHPLRAPCRDILGHVAAGRIDGVTSAEVVQEILHRFSALELRSIGAQMARDTLDLYAPVIPITHEVMARMPPLFDDYPALTARGLVHVATCQAEGISSILTPDAGFDDVRLVDRVPPDDAAAVGRVLGER